MKRINAVWIAFTLAFPMVSWSTEESIVIDPNTGDYLITYVGDNGELRQSTFVPSTKVDPAVSSSFKIERNDAISFKYRVKNGEASKQRLKVVAFSLEAAITETLAPYGWIGGIVPNDKGTIRVAWADLGGSHEKKGLVPGQAICCFAFASNSLPGIGRVRLGGAAPTLAFVDEGPGGQIGEELDRLTKPDINSVPRLVAVPTIAVPDPFSAVTVLSNVQKHVDQVLVELKLVDPVFAARLTRSLQAAIDAINGGNMQALKDSLRDARVILKREYDDVDRNGDDASDARKGSFRAIDKLAAKVLDFDIRYIQKRLNIDENTYIGSTQR